MEDFESYIGTKRIDAEPMTRGDYNKYRGWTIPADENPADEGYLVRYSDGYESWSPKSTFEATYKKSGEMNFGHAIELLKLGCKMARKGWNGKGMHLLLIKGKCIHNSITECYGDGIPEHTPEVLDSIAMYTAQKQLVIGWLASQTDMLAEDWIIIE